MPQSRSRFWTTLTAAPHRATFLPGALLTLVALAWWLLDMAARARGTSGLAPDSLPGPLLHGWLMVYGLYPFFIFGFLFTAMPNWLNGSRPTRTAFVATAGLMAAGVALMFLAPEPALLLHLAGWGVGLAALHKTLTGAAPQDKRHSWAVWVALALGWLGDGLLMIWLWAGRTEGLVWSEALGIWAFLMPVFLVVCHRMVPWFTSRVVPNYEVVRPYPLLWAMLIASLSHGLLAGLGWTSFTWLVDLPLAGIVFWFVTRWGFLASVKVRLLAVLHIGFIWAGISCLLFGLDSLAGWMGLPWSAGLAPLHALGIGFFGALLVGMASRVSLGHSGRPLVADGATWGLFWLVQLAAVTRMLPDLLPHPGALGTWLVPLSGLLWLGAFGMWAWKYAPLTWRPRADGKPG